MFGLLPKMLLKKLGVMLIVIDEQKKETSDRYGLQELMLLQGFMD